MLKSSCKKFFAGIAMVSIMGVMFPLSPTALAQTDVPTYYEKTTADRERDISLARDFADEYLKNSPEEPAWKGKKPYISSEKFFYTANDAVPSYVEFKVSTSDTADAGFIIVNLDAHDVRVPIASPAGKTPSEALESRFEKYHGSSDTEKLYYFSPFDQWMVDEDGNAEAINPRYQEAVMREEGKQVLGVNMDVNSEMILTEEWKRKQNTAFAQMKADAKHFVENSVQFRMHRMGVTPSSYVNPGMSNRFIQWTIMSNNCIGNVPCYNQFQSWWFSGCLSWCGATAIAIILGYYDWNGYGLLYTPWYAPVFNNSNINAVIQNIRQKIGTTCDGSAYMTDFYKWLQYFSERWYSPTSSLYPSNNTTTLFNLIKTEVNASRPSILRIYNNKWGHFVVVYGYSTNDKIIRVNMGWWNGQSDGYFTSWVDFHMDAIYFNWQSGWANALMTITM